MKSLFISYRQSDSQEAVALLYSFLEKHYPRECLFRDCEHLSPGMRLSDSIRDRLAKSAVLIAVIGPDWCGQSAAGFRINDPNDWVRQEIEFAVANEIPIIPLLVRAAIMPDRRSLPDSLAPLSDCLHTQLRADHNLEGDLSRLLGALKKQGLDPEDVRPTKPNLLVTVEACHLVLAFHCTEQRSGWTSDCRYNLMFEESEKLLALPCVRVTLDNRGIELRIVEANLILGAGSYHSKPLVRELPLKIFAKTGYFLWDATGLKLVEKDFKLTLDFSPDLDGRNHWMEDLIKFGIETVQLKDSQQRVYFAAAESVERTNSYLNHCFFNFDVEQRVKRIRHEHREVLERIEQRSREFSGQVESKHKSSNDSSTSRWKLLDWLTSWWKPKH